MNTPIIEAHRGFSARFPENTLRAFREAVITGAKSIELDIHSSADGELIVMHDESVVRTTNGQGNIGDMTLAQLKTLDAGSWKDPAFAGEPVPTLDETLALSDTMGIPFNIEVKRFSDIAQAKKLTALIKAHKPAWGEHVVSSFSTDALLQVREADDTIPLCQLGGDAAAILSKAKANHFQWIHSGIGTMTAEICAEAHAAGIKVMVWTLNDTTRYEEFARMGVDKICTNWVHEMLAAERIAVILENERNAKGK